VVVEEPHLREDERDRGERNRRHPRGTVDEHHQRHEPHHVLRREHLREREEAGDRGGERERKPFTRVAHACVEDPDGRHRDCLYDERKERERVGRGAAELAAGDAGRLDHTGVVESDPVEEQEERRAQALDLEAALGLGAEARVDAVCVVGGERRDDRRRHDHQHGERRGDAPRPGPPPDEHARERHQHQRVDLRRDSHPEHAEGQEAPVAEQQPEGEHRQQRGPGVVRVERDRAERDR